MAPMSASAVMDEWERSPAPQRILVGLVGRGIQLSRTPAMHEAEGIEQSLAYICRLLDVDRMGDGSLKLADILAFAQHFGFTGLNITFPYKQEIIPLLDELSDKAAAVGSVNTVVLRDGRRIGHNTDMWGFRQTFRHEMAGVQRDRILLLGAGGAGAAVAHALLDSGVKQLLVHDIDKSKALVLAERLSARFGSGMAARTSDLPAAMAHADGIVNATPVGMAKMPGIPLNADLLRPQCWVADVIYFPLETELLAEARKRGCRTMSGEGMAVLQAARSFELFTGRTANVDRMRAVFTAFGDATNISNIDKQHGRKT